MSSQDKEAERLSAWSCPQVMSSVCIRLAINTLRPRQNGCHFADDTFKCIFFNEDIRLSFKNSLKFVPWGTINNIPTLVQIMACRLDGTKPLSEPMMVSLLTHICVTRPQWVKANGRSHKAGKIEWGKMIQRHEAKSHGGMCHFTDHLCFDGLYSLSFSKNPMGIWSKLSDYRSSMSRSRWLCWTDYQGTIYWFFPFSFSFCFRYDGKLILLEVNSGLPDSYTFSCMPRQHSCSVTCKIL